MSRSASAESKGPENNTKITCSESFYRQRFPSPTSKEKYINNYN